MERIVVLIVKISHGDRKKEYTNRQMALLHTLYTGNISLYVLRVIYLLVGGHYSFAISR